MFCSEFVDRIPKIRQTKPEKLEKRLKFGITLSPSIEHGACLATWMTISKPNLKFIAAKFHMGHKKSFGRV